MELAAWCRWGLLLALLPPGAAGTQGESGGGRAGSRGGTPQPGTPAETPARAGGRRGRRSSGTRSFGLSGLWAGRGQKRGPGAGSYSAVPLDAPRSGHRRFLDSGIAAGTGQKSSLKRKVSESFAPRACCTPWGVRASSPPPSSFLKASPVGSLRLRPGLDSSGVPAALASRPSPPLLGRWRLVTRASGESWVGGGGGRATRPSRARRRGWPVGPWSRLALESGVGEGEGEGETCVLNQFLQGQRGGGAL